jgi:hypothetical protein
MPYLLDGNNLIGLFRGTARPGPEDRQALVAELGERLRRTRARAVLFFDGPAGERPISLGSLSVRVPSSGSADDAILREVQRASAPAEMVVVTADRGLARRVRDAGGAICEPSRFFEKFGRGAGTAPPGGAEARVDVEEWMRYFGDEGNRGRGR